MKKQNGVCGVLLIFVMILFCEVAWSQDELTAEDYDKQIEITKKQKELLEQQKAIMEAQQAIAEAETAIEKTELDEKMLGMPDAESKPKDGKITVDESFGYIAELLSYKTVKNSAVDIVKTIGKAVSNPGGAGATANEFLIVNDLNLSKGSIPYLQVTQRMDQFKTWISAQFDDNDKVLKIPIPDIENVMKITGLETLMITTGLVSAAADLVGYFKSNFEIKGQDFELERNALLADISRELASHGDVYIQDYNLVLSSGTLDKYKLILEEYAKLAETDEKLKIRLIKVSSNLDSVPSKKKELEAKKEESIKNGEADNVELYNRQLQDLDDAKIETERLKAEIERALAETKVLLESFTKYVESVSEGTKESPSDMIRAIMWESIPSSITHILSIKILSGGGEAITVEETFGDGDTIYIGGSVISFVLIEKNSQKVVAADTIVKAADLNYDINSSDDPVYREIKIQ